MRTKKKCQFHGKLLKIDDPSKTISNFELSNLHVFFILIGVLNEVDNCPLHFNPDQLDSEADGGDKHVKYLRVSMLCIH